MKNGRKKNGRSIFSRMTVPLMLLGVLEMCILVLSLISGGMLNELREDAIELQRGRTGNKAQLLRDMAVTHWTRTDEAADELSWTIEDDLHSRVMEPQETVQELTLNEAILRDVMPVMISHLRTSGATGAFVILNGRDGAGMENGRPGLYLRTPGTGESVGSNIQLVRGPKDLAEAYGMTLAPLWREDFSFDDKDAPYFTEPVNAAARGDTASGWWNGPFRLGEGDNLSIVTYSVPLTGRNGRVLGVLGVEVSMVYLNSLLDRTDERQQDGMCYLLAKHEGDKLHRIAFAGSSFRLFFRDNQTSLDVDEWLDGSTAKIWSTRSQKGLCGTIQPLELGGRASSWVLVGMQTEDQVAAAGWRLIRLLVIGSLAALLVCLVVVPLVSLRITVPIQDLLEELKQKKNADVLTLNGTGIREIDVLADEIVSMNRDVKEVSSRLETIMQLTGTSVGVFELRDDIDRAYCSPGFFRMFEEEEVADLTRHVCQEILDRHLTDRVDDDVWRVKTSMGERYLRVRRLQQERSLIGAVIDVTVEMKNRYRIEHERDYDVLTGMLNRRAFRRIGDDLFAGGQNKLKTAAVVMLDLDNLKYFNDKYGHDFGDTYIRTFAEAIRETFGDDRCLCARRSGDEFFLLLYGWESRRQLEAYIQNCWSTLGSKTLTLMDDAVCRLRASGGAACYPDDAKDLQTLIRYADFAMYKVKQGMKGSLEFFRRDVYQEDSYMISAREALNRMLEENLAEYYFQPIVDTRDGSVYGYELLMRPLVEELPNPGAVLRLAKSRSLLHQVERMTWQCAMRDAKSMTELGLLPKGTKLFINSIADQMLTAEEEAAMHEQYAELFSSVVMEITESEAKDLEYMRHKDELMRKMHAEIAIDDYGSGHNSEAALLEIRCEYVKLDMIFIRDVDTNLDKQELIRSLVGYARRRGTRVLAEGVETASELQMLMVCGVDYLQGYYTGRPQKYPQQIRGEAKADILRWHAEHDKERTVS